MENLCKIIKNPVYCILFGNIIVTCVPFLKVVKTTVLASAAQQPQSGGTQRPCSRHGIGILTYVIDTFTPRHDRSMQTAPPSPLMK